MTTTMHSVRRLTAALAVFACGLLARNDAAAADAAHVGLTMAAAPARTDAGTAALQNALARKVRRAVKAWQAHSQYAAAARDLSATVRVQPAGMRTWRIDFEFTQTLDEAARTSLLTDTRTAAALAMPSVIRFTKDQVLHYLVQFEVRPRWVVQLTAQNRMDEDASRINRPSPRTSNDLHVDDKAAQSDGSRGATQAAQARTAIAQRLVNDLRLDGSPNEEVQFDAGEREPSARGSAELRITWTMVVRDSDSKHDHVNL